MGKQIQRKYCGWKGKLNLNLNCKQWRYDIVNTRKPSQLKRCQFEGRKKMQTSQKLKMRLHTLNAISIEKTQKIWKTGKETIIYILHVNTGTFPISKLTITFFRLAWYFSTRKKPTPCFVVHLSHVCHPEFGE